LESGKAPSLLVGLFITPILILFSPFVKHYAIIVTYTISKRRIKVLISKKVFSLIWLKVEQPRFYGVVYLVCKHMNNKQQPLRRTLQQ
jgi:hypothetical protein